MVIPANSEVDASTASSTTAASTTADASPVILPAKKQSGFHRFIDELFSFVKKAAPVADQLANAAKPIMALTPFGPEYNLAVTGIETAVQADVATQAASGIPLTNLQKMALALQVSTPGITQILASKGITEPVPVQTAISGFVQTVYDLHTGPTAAATPATAAVTK